MADVDALFAKIKERFTSQIIDASIALGEITIEVKPEQLHEVCSALKTEAVFQFNMLVDVCGVDYLHYGVSEWETEEATASGFERGVDRTAMKKSDHAHKPRFASVYHLLSTTLNHRVRLRARIEDNDQPKVPSVIDIWPSANWFERESFDLFGIIYVNHPDLRRILTDYGFVGHPFRKDFPLIGNVEARYDAKQQRVVYEPVSIQPRVLEPKVIRRNLRYETGE